MDLTKRIHQYTRGAWTFDVIDSYSIDTSRGFIAWLSRNCP